MLSSFIGFFENFIYFKASSSVSTSCATSEALLAAVDLYFSKFSFTLETTLSIFSLAFSESVPYSDFTFSDTFSYSPIA